MAKFETIDPFGWVNYERDLTFTAAFNTANDCINSDSRDRRHIKQRMSTMNTSYNHRGWLQAAIEEGFSTDQNVVPHSFYNMWYLEIDRMFLLRLIKSDYTTISNFSGPFSEPLAIKRAWRTPLVAVDFPPYESEQLAFDGFGIDNKSFSAFTPLPNLYPIALVYMTLKVEIIAAYLVDQNDLPITYYPLTVSCTSRGHYDAIAPERPMFLPKEMSPESEKK